MAIRSLCSPGQLWDFRHTVLDAYIQSHERFFGELPDDWHLLVRTHMDLPLKKKRLLLKKLQEEHDWEIEGLTVKRAKHRDGRLLPMVEFKDQYGAATGRFVSRLSRTIRKSVRREKGIK